MSKKSALKPTKRPDGKFVTTAAENFTMSRKICAAWLRIAEEYYDIAYYFNLKSDPENKTKYLARKFGIHPDILTRYITIFHYYRTSPDEITMNFESYFLCTINPAVLEAFIPYLQAHFKGPRTGIGPHIYVTPLSIEVRMRWKGGQFMWVNLATLTVEQVQGLREHIMTDDERRLQHDARRARVGLIHSPGPLRIKSPKEIELERFLDNGIRHGVPVPV